MQKSSSASVSSGKTQARRARPPSPVSMYGGGLGYGPVKPPPPLPSPRVKKTSKPSHSRTASASTSSSHKSDDTSSNNSHGNSGKKSLESFIPSWKKKNRLSSLPSSPMPGVNFKSQTIEHELDDDFLPTLAEARVRQLNKVTRTFGERVPVEYIVPGEMLADPIIVPDSAIHSHPEDLPPVDIISSGEFTSSRSENDSPHSSRTSSPVLPAQDRYHYRKKTPTFAPITNSFPPSNVESRPESPILFSQFPRPPATIPQPQSTEKTKTDPYVPLLLRQPRPAKPFSTLPTASLPDVDNDNTSAKAATLPQRARTERAHANAIATMFNEDPVARPDSPFQDSTVPLHAWLTTTFATRKDPTVRQETKQGWTGEWNRNDMQDVISQLRHLK